MLHEKDKRVIEVAAVIIIILLLWNFFKKKKAISPEPATTKQEIEDQFAGDPNFNLNDYCQDVIYRPLADGDLKPEQLMGGGWCSRGDRSIIDEKKGFGDEYADKQAQDYIAMKQGEALIINNKLCVQFRLINTGATPITTDLLNTTQDPDIFNGNDDNPGPTPPPPPTTDFGFDLLTTAPNELVTLPIYADDSGLYPSYGQTFNYNFTVDYGDGSGTQTVTSPLDPAATHIYTTPGTYTVLIKGLCECFASNFGSQLVQMTKINTWGNIGCLRYDLSYTQLADMPKDDAGAFSLIVHFDWTFSGTLISVIPDNLLDLAQNCLDMNFMFAYCPNVTVIPAEIFKQLPNIEYITYAFIQVPFTTIPTDLLRYNVNLKSIEGSFAYGIYPNIPADIILYNVNLISVKNAWELSDVFSAIPAGMFDTNVLLEDFAGTFYNSNGFTVIPADLFKFNVNAKKMGGIFSRTSVTAIPVGMLDTNVLLEDVNGLFSITNITVIPSAFFANNPLITSFQSVFELTKISSIPANLFAPSLLAINMSIAFGQCTQLTSIPATLFNGLPNVTTFLQTFERCGLTLTGLAPTLWLRVPAPIGGHCYYQDFNLTNYASIPPVWQ